MIPENPEAVGPLGAEVRVRLSHISKDADVDRTLRLVSCRGERQLDELGAW